ncbi:hypothetical protein GCK32_018586, partial [Trichostrongylus colubriformis]
IAAPHRSGAYCYGVEKLGQQAFDKVLELFKVETVAIEKSRLLGALGCRKDVSALKSILELAMKPDQIRLQDVGSVFGTVASNHVATELVFNYFFENWERLNARFQGQLFVLKRIAGACLNVGYTEKHYNR